VLLRATGIALVVDIGVPGLERLKMDERLVAHGGPGWFCLRVFVTGLMRPGLPEADAARSRPQGRFAPLRGGLRPALTVPARAVLQYRGLDDETASQPSHETI